MSDFNSSNPLLVNQINKAGITIELIRVKVLIAFLSFGVIIMATDFFLVEGGASFFKHSSTKFVVIGWMLSFLLFEIISLGILSRYFKKKVDLPSSIKTINTILEASFYSY